jgi:hypothetical protein
VPSGQLKSSLSCKCQRIVHSSAAGALEPLLKQTIAAARPRMGMLHGFISLLFWREVLPGWNSTEEHVSAAGYLSASDVFGIDPYLP